MDNFSKLEKQVMDYYKVFPYVSVLVPFGSKIDIPTVGIYYLKDEIEQIREPVYNDKSLDYKEMMKALRKNEYTKIVKSYYNVGQINDFDYWEEYFKLFKTIDKKELIEQITKILKERG